MSNSCSVAWGKISDIRHVSVAEIPALLGYFSLGEL